MEVRCFCAAARTVDAKAISGNGLLHLNLIDWILILKRLVVILHCNANEFKAIFADSFTQLVWDMLLIL
jgi:hypothetical protein